MATIRSYAVCETCKKTYTLRISVGHSEEQYHEFACVECNSLIKLKMLVNFKEVSAKIEHLENCSLGDSEGLIVNLSSEMPVGKDELHQDSIFPWMSQVEKFIAPIDSDEKPDSTVKFKDFRAEMGGAPDLPKDWKDVKAAWTLINSNRYDLAHGPIESYLVRHPMVDASLHAVIFDFLDCFCGEKRFRKFNQVGEWMRDNLVGCNNFEKFCKHYKKRWFRGELEATMLLLDDYFKYYSDFNQTYLYAINEVPLEENAKVSSTNFLSTRMFYGNAFERYAESVKVLACFNNISQRRDFDKFQSMSLAKYLQLNKSSRFKCFSGNKTLVMMTTEIVSTLRNATHHSSAKYDSSNQTITYQSGGTGAVRSMSYAEYLLHCNHVAMAACSMMMLGFILYESR